MPTSVAQLPRLLRNRVFFGYSAILSDLVVWLAAVELATLARFDFDARFVHWERATELALYLVAGQIVLGSLVLLYRGRYLPGSFDEMRAVAVSVTAVSAIASAVVLLLSPTGIPRSVPFLAWPLALLGMAAVRFAKRLIWQASSKPAGDAERVVIYGAGQVGNALAQRMLRDPKSDFRPVAFLDDDPSKRHFQAHGVRVQGGIADLAAVVAHVDATRVIVAINGADAALIRAIADAADDLDIACMVLPPLSDILRVAQIQLSTLRNVDVQDVIGRRPVDTDVRSIANYVTGRRVLVTGAGGSIGAELCRQLYKYGPAELVLLDRDESALHAVELSVYGRALLDSECTVLADIRDQDALDQIFVEHQPQVVFHAAALKHLTLLERFPLEAVRTNVYGTLNVLESAARHGVDHFVNISTDKAANAISALGHSKRLAERLTSWFALQASDAGDTKFLSVRFGNVLGSRGSVLHAFASQIEADGPVTVTSPEVSRFFMTIPEACQLVIQAGAIGSGGEALVLDMGNPVKVVEVARRMIAMSGKKVDIVFTGLRPGEKVHEELFGLGERDERPHHPLISHVDVPPLDPLQLVREPWMQRSMRRTPPIVGAEAVSRFG